ncbi:Vms1/Ankzf1 family peptidyl-tRNA hydrolase [Haladaptatus pallidirubidus]|uniref:Vms1/Ankzf1 family peptidyl-tRNA hydrolase n=1 Tax=Haladaptatus pallidirubidus TaxID=1008152 RepID=A0AAV3UE13_9EURY|nr:Vms1/Ankzf1 family peptidyl-tRNA hydrolase [Haladaptatus pallidirubidus]
MLDELLGRAELKERIDALEEEKHHLERQRDAEKERRAEAVTERQQAEERVNRLEDRIEELEDRVERLRGDDGDLDFRGVETLRGKRLDAVLSRLGSVEAEPEGALTAMVDGNLPGTIREAFDDHAPLVSRAVPGVVVTDDAGLVSGVLVPPNPPEPFVTWDDSFEFETDWFRPEGKFSLALVRSDLFAIGEYDGRDRRSVSGFESDVKSDHSKGGFSQGRFERRRDAQIDEHLKRCREEIENRDAERLYVVGQRTLLPEFRKQARLTKPVDATGDPEDALEDAFRELWTTRLYRI